MGALSTAVLCVSCCTAELAMHGQCTIWVLDTPLACVHACNSCNSSQGESDWCPDVTSTHGVQRCTGVRFLLSGDGFCPRRHGEARAGKHGAAAAALLRPRWPHATASYEYASTRVMVRMFDLAPRIHCRTARGMGGGTLIAFAVTGWFVQLLGRIDRSSLVC